MNLWYLVPLEERFISVLQPSKGRNSPVACNLFNLHKGITFVLCMCSNCQSSRYYVLIIINLGNMTCDNVTTYLCNILSVLHSQPVNNIV